MREWADKEELLDRCAQAMRDAANTAPRSSNEHVEAAKILAVMVALDKYFEQKQQSQAAGPAESPAARVEEAPVRDSEPPTPTTEQPPMPEVEYSNVND